MPQKRYFLLTSPGYTATKWAAWALNLHPHVYCNHSAGSDILERAYTHAELEALVLDKTHHRDEVPLDHFFDTLDPTNATTTTTTTTIALGNTHRYNLSALCRNVQRWPHRSFEVANMVRHPIPWVASGTAQMENMACGVPLIRGRLERHARRRDGLLQHLGAPKALSLTGMAFSFMCERLMLLAREAQMKQYYHVKMEDITQSPKALRALVHRLTAIEPDDAYLQQVLQSGPIHRHNPSQTQGPNALFGRWAMWQQRLFVHWAEESGIFELYDRFGYAPPLLPSLPSSQAPFVFTREDKGSSPAPCAPAHVKAVVQRQLDVVAASDFDLRGSLETSYQTILDRLHEDLRRSGLGPWLGGPRAVAFSPGEEGGISPLLKRPFFQAQEEDWNVAVAHPYLQDRSPGLAFYNPSAKTFLVSNLKGAGLRSQHQTFLSRGGRCQAYVSALQARGHKPIDVLFDYPPHEWASHTLLGGALLLPSLCEARYALAWHGLLLELDGDLAATAIPLRISFPKELPARRGEGQKTEHFALWDYFTNPALMHQKQLQQVGQEAGRNDIFLRPLFAWKKRRFLKLAASAPDALLSPKNTHLRRTIGESYASRKGPVIYEHFSRAKLRVGHLWQQLSRDDVFAEQLAALYPSKTPAHAKVFIDLMMHEVYASNRRCLSPPPHTDFDLFQQRGRFAYLRDLFLAHQESAEAIMAEVGQKGGRSLGALHGVGGHCLGRRLKQRDAQGRPRLDSYGINLRMGAAGGGATAPRNMSVCGEWMDTSMVFNPREALSRIARRLSSLWPAPFAFALQAHVPLFQAADVELAEEGLAQFGAIMMGNPALVPTSLESIAALRKERKQLEDTITTKNRRSLVPDLEAIERNIANLRRDFPGYEETLSLRHFRRSYHVYLSLARELP